MSAKTELTCATATSAHYYHSSLAAQEGKRKMTDENVDNKAQGVSIAGAADMATERGKRKRTGKADVVEDVEEGHPKDIEALEGVAFQALEALKKVSPAGSDDSTGLLTGRVSAELSSYSVYAIQPGHLVRLFSTLGNQFALYKVRLATLVESPFLCRYINKLLKNPSAKGAVYDVTPHETTPSDLILFTDLNLTQMTPKLHMHMVDTTQVIAQGGYARIFSSLSFDIDVPRQDEEGVTRPLEVARTVDSATREKDANKKLAAYQRLNADDDELKKHHIAPRPSSSHIHAMITSEGIVTQSHLEMVYFPEKDLSSQIGSITVEKALNFQLQLMEALSFCASKGVRHGDVKLANILISQGNIYLADFGNWHKIDEVHRCCVSSKPLGDINRPYFCWDLCSIQGLVTANIDAYGAVICLGVLVLGNSFAILADTSQTTSMRDAIMSEDYDNVLKNAILKCLRGTFSAPFINGMFLDNNDFDGLVEYLKSFANLPKLAADVYAMVRVHKFIKDVVSADLERWHLVSEDADKMDLLRRGDLEDPLMTRFNELTVSYSILETERFCKELLSYYIAPATFPLLGEEVDFEQL